VDEGSQLVLERGAIGIAPAQDRLLLPFLVTVISNLPPARKLLFTVVRLVRV
jgi:hypothetical protein